MASRSADDNGSSPRDWPALHARLAAAREAAERAATVSPERRREILQARARRAAVDSSAGGAPRESIEVVEFNLAHEVYALPCRFVREVAKLRELAVVPGAPSFVLGVCTLRGKIVSIYDLRRFFGLPPSGLTDLNRVIVLTHADLEFGVLADAVGSVTHVYVDDLAEPVATLNPARARFCRGIAPTGVIVLDGLGLLSDPELTGRSNRERAENLREEERT